MQNPPLLPAYAKLVDDLIDRATNDQLADVARLLAINIGYYQQRFGEVPQEILLKMAQVENLDRKDLDMVAAGMQNLVSALAEVTGLTDELTEEPRH